MDNSHSNKLENETPDPVTVTEITSAKFSTLSFLAAILVVAIHCCNIPPPTVVGSGGWGFREAVARGLGTAAVPFFFIQSGFFLAGRTKDDGWWWTAIRKRIKSLLIPFLIWSLLFWGLGVAIGILHGLWSGRLDAADVFLRQSYLYHHGLAGRRTILGWNPLKGCYVGAFWYMRALLFFVLASPAIVWTLHKTKGLVLIALFTLYYTFGVGQIATPPKPVLSVTFAQFFRDGLSLEGLFYFSTGMFLRFHPVHIRTEWAYASLVTACLLAIWSTICQWTLFPTWIHGNLLHIPFLLVSAWRFAPARRLPWKLTGLTFPLFLLHMFVLEPIRHGFSGMSESALASFIRFAVVLFGTIFLSMGIRRFAPRFSSISFGGR